MIDLTKKFNDELVELAFQIREAERIKNKTGREAASEIAFAAYYKKLDEWNEYRGETLNIGSVKSEPITPRHQLIGGNEAGERYITSATYERAKKRKFKEVNGFLSGTFR